MERKWKVDESNMRQMLSRILGIPSGLLFSQKEQISCNFFVSPFPCWMFRQDLMFPIFPQLSTQCIELFLPFLRLSYVMQWQKCIRSQKYAAKHGWTILNNMLLPKTKGFYACMEQLRGSLDAGYYFYSMLYGYYCMCSLQLFFMLLKTWNHSFD